MVNTDKLRGKIVENRTSVDAIAKAIGCNKSTVYRKMKDGGGDITIDEIRIFSTLLHLTQPEINEIFFAE